MKKINEYFQSAIEQVKETRIQEEAERAEKVRWEREQTLAQLRREKYLSDSIATNLKELNYLLRHWLSEPEESELHAFLMSVIRGHKHSDYHIIVRSHLVPADKQTSPGVVFREIDDPIKPVSVVHEHLKAFNFHDFFSPASENIHFFLALLVPYNESDLQNMQIVLCNRKKDPGGFITVEEAFSPMPPIVAIDDYIKKIRDPKQFCIEIANWGLPAT